MAELIIFVGIPVGVAIAIMVAISFAIGYAHKKADEKRQDEIWQHQSEWGDGTCWMLVRKEIAIDMTEEMVRLGWGNPTNIEMKELTKKGQKTRWVYGQPRKGARYVWFTDRKVTKIQS